MNKNRMILAVAGGVTCIAVLAAAYFTWSSWSAKSAAVDGDDESEGLDAVVAKAEKLSRSPVYPCAESVKATEENAAKLAEWMAGARRLAARGDRVFPKTTPPAFKTFLVQDAKRLVSLPGSAAGVLAQPDFAFGPFKGYIAGGDLPSDAQLAELQRRWDDIAVVTETLAACGIGELTDVQFKTAEKPKEEPQQNARGNRRQAKKPTKKAAQSDKAGEGASSISSFSYVFSFSAKPHALVKAVNALETCERFVSVDDFSFRREKDAIAETLGADEKKAEAAQAGGRRRRRGGGAPVSQAEEKKESAMSGIVTDPQLDATFAVTMTVTVHDFKSLEDTDKNGEESK